MILECQSDSGPNVLLNSLVSFSLTSSLFWHWNLFPCSSFLLNFLFTFHCSLFIHCPCLFYCSSVPTVLFYFPSPSFSSIFILFVFCLHFLFHVLSFFSILPTFLFFSSLISCQGLSFFFLILLLLFFIFPYFCSFFSAPYSAFNHFCCFQNFFYFFFFLPPKNICISLCLSFFP